MSTEPKAHLISVPTGTSSSPPVAPPAETKPAEPEGSQRIRVLLPMVCTLLGALAGAISAYTVDVLKEQRTIAPQQPMVRIATVQVAVPTVEIPDPNHPPSPADIEQRMKELKDVLGMTSSSLSIRETEAPELTKAVAAAVSLSDIRSPSGYIDVDVWRDDIERSIRTLGVYSNTISYVGDDGVLGILRDNALSDEQCRSRFEQFASSIPHKAFNNAFMIAVEALMLRVDDPRSKRVRDPVRRATRPVVWADYPIPAPAGLTDHLMMFGKNWVRFETTGNVRQHLTIPMLTSVVSVFDRSRMVDVFALAVDHMNSESAALRTFLAKSNQMLGERVDPRIVVESVVINPHRLPITILPTASLAVRAPDVEQLNVPLSHVSVLGVEKNLEYETVESGKLMRIAWTGGSKTARDTWDKLSAAYRSRTLTCELVISTLDSNKKGTSPPAPFSRSAGP